MTWRKVCAFCSEPFHTSYRTKKTCSFDCGKKYGALQARKREQARKQRKRATRLLGEPHQPA
jgi:hypothetical protein